MTHEELIRLVRGACEDVDYQNPTHVVIMLAVPVPNLKSALALGACLVGDMHELENRLAGSRVVFATVDRRLVDK